MSEATWCACRDCMEIVVGTPGITLCWECIEDDCNIYDPQHAPFSPAYFDCQRARAYGE